MEATKKWYHSRAVWGGIIVLLGTFGNAYGVSVDDATRSALIESVTEAITAIGGLLAIWGRLRADKEIE